MGIIKYVEMKSHRWGARHSQEETEIFLLDGWECIYKTDSGWSDFWVGSKSIHDTKSGFMPDDYNETTTARIGNGGQSYYVDIGGWLDMRDDRSPNGEFNSYTKISAKLADAMGWNPYTLTYEDVWHSIHTVCETINELIALGFGVGEILKDWDDEDNL